MPFRLLVDIAPLPAICSTTASFSASSVPSAAAADGNFVLPCESMPCVLVAIFEISFQNDMYATVTFSRLFSFKSNN